MARRIKQKRQVVFHFREGDAQELFFGGKGSGLMRMISGGIPVPPGFTVSTGVCRAYMQEGKIPNRVAWQLNRGIAHIERETGKKFGASSTLLVSVRSGAPVSMPGMMDTILNLGINQDVCRMIAEETNNEMFAKDLLDRFQKSFKEVVGVESPDDPYRQLLLAVESICHSWNGNRAQEYREVHGIAGDMGTAVVVQAMVFGNASADSCTGVVFSRNVASGQPGLYGEFLPNAQGEELVSGERTPLPLSGLEVMNPDMFFQLKRTVSDLERADRDAVDVEFTVERGKLWILQCRKAKRTRQAGCQIAVDMVKEGLLSHEEIVRLFSREELRELCRPVTTLKENKLFKTRKFSGLPASPGVAVGKAIFSAEKAQKMADSGEPVVLVRPDTNPNDFGGMIRSVAIVTGQGGSTCHAAVTARALDTPIPAVVGTSLVFDDDVVRVNGCVVREGDWLSVDGTRGVVYLAKLDVVESGEVSPAVTILLEWIEEFSRRVDFNLINEHWCVNTFLNDVYILEILKHETQNEMIRDKVLLSYSAVMDQVACIFATYLLAAVAGELRHAWGRTSGGRNLQKLEAWGILEGRDRTEAQVTSVKILLETGGRSKLVEFCSIAEEVFHDFEGGSFGGVPWAEIAKTLRLYLSGEINQTLFVDRTFDLRHNGGVLFNKHPMVFCQAYDESQLKRQLDVKRSGASSRDRIALLLQLHQGISPEVAELLKQ